MVDTVKVQVGSVHQMGQRFIDAWRRLERGDAVSVSSLTLATYDELRTLLSPSRLRLLRHVHAHDIKDLDDLSGALNQASEHVGSDVAALVRVGLLVMDDGGVRRTYDRMLIVLPLSR